MKAPQVWKLERNVYNGWLEVGMDAAHKRRTDSDSAVKAFTENVQQVDDNILNMLRFQAFLEGWKNTIEYDREKERSEDANQS